MIIFLESMPEQNEIESLKREISELKNLLNSKEELLRKKIQVFFPYYHFNLNTYHFFPRKRAFHIMEF